MKTKLLGALSLITLIFTVLWLVLLIISMAGAGPLDTFEQARAYAEEGGLLFTLTYVNAALVTLSAALLFADLYAYCRTIAPELALVGLVFIPVYAAMNLFVYLAQITAVPALLSQSVQADYRPAADLLLRLLLQAWPGSAMAFFNNLAYAILGIPSIIFGLILLSRDKLPRLSAILLVLNGAACVLGAVGALLGSRALASGSLVGGVLFLAALFPLAFSVFRGEKSVQTRLLPAH